MLCLRAVSRQDVMLCRTHVRRWSVSNVHKSHVTCHARLHIGSSLRDQQHSSKAPSSDKLDQHLEHVARSLCAERHISLKDLHNQYQYEAGAVIDRVLPYEERPHVSKRADVLEQLGSSEPKQGDGIVLVVHAHFGEDGSALLKTTVCSGFVVNASTSKSTEGDAIVTCAHTLDEMNRYLQRHNEAGTDASRSFSFIVPSTGPPRIVTRLLSSMPRSDVVVLEAQPISPAPRLRPVPLTPFPVYTGTPVLTHLFGAPDPPPIQHSIARTKAPANRVDTTSVEAPIQWLDGLAWRRWGAGVMLGYRSYTGLELEAGISSVLPHILTSILPTPGSSGGPLVNAETGSVVGMISGRRMDNRVEGERGWGCSSEGIFEMFSLPGFMPTKATRTAYP